MTWTALSFGKFSAALVASKILGNENKRIKEHPLYTQSIRLWSDYEHLLNPCVYRVLGLLIGHVAIWFVLLELSHMAH